MALSAALLLAPNAMAADDKTNINNADERFIQDEAATGVAIVQMAELAEKNAQHEDVKTFAGTLVVDHTKANAELKKLAANKGVELSSKPDSKYTNNQEKLQKTKGADFDKEFLSMTIDTHEKCVKNFTKASTDAKDSDLKAWAVKMLPVQQAHLAKAEQLNAEVNAKEDTLSSVNSATKSDNAVRNQKQDAQSGNTVSTNVDINEQADNNPRHKRDFDAQSDTTTAVISPDRADQSDNNALNNNRDGDHKADNTARNKRDRDDKTATPLDQGNNDADIATTAQIRREIVDMKGFSVNAQNVKIITNEGRVTLRGPVDSADEKRKIGEIANKVATAENTDNQLEVRSPSAGN